MRRSLQAALGVDADPPQAAVDELVRYAEIGFETASSAVPAELPLADEPVAASWSPWVEQAKSEGVLPVLRAHLPQLCFPIREGISESPAYRAAVLRGEPAEGDGLAIERPESLELSLHPSLAGRIPVITVTHRPDFETLVQALAKRNEPVPIAPTQGASMVGGLPNWSRIRALRCRWDAGDPAIRRHDTWARDWQRLARDRSLYQDRLIVLGDGPYSGVPANELGLTEERWRELSLRIRREHECTHYLTRRLYGSMRNHLLDELIADYCGMVHAVGRFRAGWFRRFLGLAAEPSQPHTGRRIDLYRGDPPLSPDAFALLIRLAEHVAETLEAFDRERWPEEVDHPARRATMVRTLASLRLPDLVAPDGPERLRAAFDLHRVEHPWRGTASAGKRAG